MDSSGSYNNKNSLFKNNVGNKTSNSSVDKNNVHIIKLSDMMITNHNHHHHHDNNISSSGSNTNNTNNNPSVTEDDNHFIDDYNFENESDSDIISKYIGHIGKWQIYWAILLCLFQFPNTFHIFAFVFQAAEKDFWCARPDHMKTMNVNEWRNMTQPQGACTIIFNYTAMGYNKNNYLAGEADESSSALLLSIDHLINCNKFEYDDTTDGSMMMGDTLISEWDLVCERAKLLSVVEMCFLAGAAVGSICSGWISDKYGRRHSLMIFSTIQTITGTVLAFSQSLEMFMVLRVLIGFASMSIINISFVLVVELVSGKWRTIIGILNILPVALSYIVMAGIAFVTRDWRTTQLVISIPGFFMLLIWFFLPESPRWLLANNRTDELIHIIEIAAMRNNIYLPLNYEKSLISPAGDSMQSDSVSFANLFKSKYLRTTLLMIITWYSLILVYFGITLHLSNLGGNIYINTAIAGAVESIAIFSCIFVVLKSGIKINLVIYMLLAGIVCLMVNLIPNGNLWGIISLAMIGKCTIGATNALIPTFTAFQYPTTMRTLAIGVGNFAAGLALITVPYLWLLEHIEPFLPMTIMGIFALIGAIAVLLMNDKKIIINNNDDKSMIK